MDTKNILAEIAATAVLDELKKEKDEEAEWLHRAMQGMVGRV